MFGKEAQRGPGAVQPVEFVVPDVHNKNIRVQARALPGDLHDHMRVDPPHGSVDHLNGTIGIKPSKHDLQNPNEPKRRVRRPHRSRFAQDEDPDGVLGLLDGDQARLRLGHRLLLVMPSEVNVRRPQAGQFASDKERSRIPCAQKRQQDFQQKEKHDRARENREHAPHPKPPGRKRRCGPPPGPLPGDARIPRSVPSGLGHRVPMIQPTICDVTTPWIPYQVGLMQDPNHLAKSPRCTHGENTNMTDELTLQSRPDLSLSP